MNYTIAIDAYQPSQLPSLFRLFRTHFGEGDRLLSAEYSEWLYGQNPFGQAKMISVRGGAEWVAFVAFVPVTFERAGARAPAYYAVNALVHPAHQGQRLFARMITAGREHIAGEGCVLLGHPNPQAMRTWDHMQMHFQEVLRPAVAIPWLRSRGWHSHSAESAEDLDPLRSVLAKQAASREHWKVAVSKAFLQWRYFDQPGHRYRVHILEGTGQPAGFQIVRKMRPGLHLMIDQFVADEHLPAATSLLPPMTVCFLSESARRCAGGALLRLPVKKELPYFYTMDPPVAQSDVRHLNLSATDF